jgi:uncharacterized delta-60 repeat protein
MPQKEASFDPKLIGALTFDEVGCGSKEAIIKRIRNSAFRYYVMITVLSVTPLFMRGALLDPKFHAGTGADGGVSELAVQPNGRILVAGGFETFDNVKRPNLVRLFPNGKIDRSFDAEVSFPGIYSIVVQPDKKILIGGEPGLFRLQPRGRLDGTFDIRLPGTDVGRVYAVALQTDGKVLVAGPGSASFALRQPVIRVLPDGFWDRTFRAQMDQYQNGYAVLVRADGKIFVGGTFRVVNNRDQWRIALLNSDGTTDTSFNTVIGASEGRFVPYVSPYDIKLQADGKILFGGFFQFVNGAYRRNIARVHADGTLDESFNPFPGLENGFNGVVNSIALQGDGKILAAGEFTTYNGVPRNYLARLNPDGSLDESFNSGAGPNGPLSKVLLLPNNRLLIGGSYSSFDGVPQGNISWLILD